MTQPGPNIPPIGAVLTGPHWLDRVRLVRVEPQGANRVLLEAVALDGQNRLISRSFKLTDLNSLKELKLRGTVSRTLIVAPANLAPQWQREMSEKFGETFDLVDWAALAARGSPAWELTDQCVTSLDFAWRPEALESLARARRWDLVVFDEAHKLAAYRRGSKLNRTRHYRLGEVLTGHTDHLLLATATPHRGAPENFRLLLQLLDPDLFATPALLARVVQRHPKSRNYRVSVKANRIDVYERVGPDAEYLTASLSSEGLLIPGLIDRLRVEEERYGRFTPVLRFILADAEKRIFRSRRMCYLGSIDGWIDSGPTGPVESLAQELSPRLGTDRFFEVY